MADGQAVLTAPPEEVNVTTPPNAPVEQVPSAASAAMLQPQAANTAVPQPAISSDVLAGLAAAQPLAQTMQGTPSVPAAPSPPIEEHMGGIHRILDTVATLMGGGSHTLHATRDADGNMQVTSSRSTTAEKWERIAAAALGGAAQGLANSQGPGGLARAAAAGTQYGLKLPAQEHQAVQQEVTADQQRMLANANNAALHIRNMQSTIGLRDAGIRLAQEEADIGNAVGEESRNGINTQLVASGKDMQDIVQHHQQNPDLVRYLNGDPNYKTFVSIDASGQPTVNLYKLDLGASRQRNTQPYQMPVVQYDSKTAEPTLTSKTVAPGTDLLGKLDDSARAVYAGFLDQKAKWATAQKNLAEADKPGAKVPTTYEGIVAAANLETDPTRKAQLMAAAKQLQATELRKFAPPTVNIRNTPSSADAITDWANQLANPNSGVTMAHVKPADRNAVLAYMRQNNMSIAHPITQKEIDRSDLANNAILNIEEAQRILQARPDMFGPYGWGKNKLRRAIEGGDTDAMRYATAINLANLPAVGIHGVRGKYALMDIANLDSDLYTNPDAMAGILDEIHRSASDFREMGGRVVQGGGGGGTQRPTNRTQQPTSFTVTDPKGGVHTFSSQDKADAFKRLAGIK